MNQPCDFNCGRPATMTIGKLVVCDQCASEPNDFSPSPPRLFQDVIGLDGPLDDEEI
jgi:hypothetical protein